MKLRIWDFCAGAGGSSAGFQIASSGHHHVGVDKWNLALQTYQHNIENSEVIETNILDFDVSTMGKVDIIHCSPPCPGFSGMNVRGNRDRDPSIIYKCLDIIEQARPRFWILEQSPFAAPFVPYPRFLCANDFGLYHERRRLFAGNYPDVRPTRQVKVIHSTIVAHELKAYNKNMRHRPDARSCCQWFGRRLASWELQILMGFPSDYFFYGNYDERCIQIGNAVCPPVSKAILDSILLHWNEKSLLEYANAMA